MSLFYIHLQVLYLSTWYRTRAYVQEEQDVIKVSVFYPYGDGKKFDMGYYLNKHIPMVKKLLGASCKGTSVEQ